MKTIAANFIRIKRDMGNACSHMEPISRVFQCLSLSFRSASDKSSAQLQMMHHKLTSLCSVFLRFEDYIIKILGSKSADVRRVEVWTTQCDNIVI